MNRRRIFSTVLTTVLFFSANAITAHPARAQKAALDWTGFYAGGHFGYGWGDTTDDVGPHGFNPAAILQTVNPNPSGYLGGLQAGFNYQLDQLVSGFEADIAYADIKGSASGLSAISGNSTVADQRLDMFGTVRGRVGFVPGSQWFVYGTGGFAYGHGKLATNIGVLQNCAGGICELGSGSKILTGWTVGAGAEYAMSNHWSFKVEYLYYDLGKLTHRSTDVTSHVSDFGPSADFAGNIVRAGLNYKFSGPN